jgi:hypothetical protein
MSFRLRVEDMGALRDLSVVQLVGSFIMGMLEEVVGSWRREYDIR